MRLVKGTCQWYVMTDMGRGDFDDDFDSIVGLVLNALGSFLMVFRLSHSSILVKSL